MLKTLRLPLGLFFLACLLPPAHADVDRADREPLAIHDGQRVAFVGNSTAERMNLFGHLETRLHLRFHSKRPLVRNFGWPADEVGLQQRPGNYTLIDDPMQVFGPDLFLCFFGFNESFAGTDASAINTFVDNYRKYIDRLTQEYTIDGRKPRFVLVTPIAMESTGNPLHPDATKANARLKVYADAIVEFGRRNGFQVVRLFEPTAEAFAAEPGAQYTVSGIHLNELGDDLIAKEIDQQLFGSPLTPTNLDHYNRVRHSVQDKAWLHLQDYRMLNGWYVYGGRRTWDTETFPTEYRKIREMVSVRDRYVWDLAAGRTVPDAPDDSATGDVYTPETMYGSRDESFRKMREPKTLEYPTPEDSISQMTVPTDFEVQLFASEREFPELANPTQLAFDNKGRLWVACMVNYPQWLPGAAKPNDRLLILEDTDGDGKADQCKTFYDKLICPTGFEFYDGGVLVIDEPRILHLKDTDGDDVADQAVQLIDGVATDDTHHTMGAWEYSHGGLLHMQEGVKLSTTLETPWGPFRNNGPSGSYVWDLDAMKVRHFRTPAYGNPWCLVFDSWGNGIIGDGTNANQHWASLLSGAAVQSRRSVEPVFNNEGMRPAVGNEFLLSRHFPDDVQGQFIYACVINMHGMPRFTIRDEPGTAGFTGERIDDLLSSTDMFFRPVDPKIGPDGALWFGDWCNALIGHMQYSQRDPNRDHVHGRIYRLVYKNKPLLEPKTQADKSIPELLDQLKAYEQRTRYRARRELRDRNKDQVLAAAAKWIAGSSDPNQLCEVLWLQEAFHSVDPDLVARIMQCDDFHARAAAIHVVGNQWQWMDDSNQFLRQAIVDDHPRVRLEALRAVSFQPTLEAMEIALKINEKPTDPWINYVLEHTLQALEPVWQEAMKDPNYVASLSPETLKALKEYQAATGPGAKIYGPLKIVENADLSADAHEKALAELVAADGGKIKNGAKIFERACAACHMHGTLGKKFGPNLTDIGDRFTKEKVIRSVVWPNEEISKGYETVMLLTLDGETINGFVLSEDDNEITLGIADGKTKTVLQDDIEIRKPMKASSMPEGLLETIAPSEFLDLIAFLSGGWITTDPNPKQALRKKGEFVELSRDASLKLGDDFPGNLNRNAKMLLSGKKAKRQEFAFHSANGESAKSGIVIRLGEPAEIRHVELANRSKREFHDRADGLTMWISEDGKQWRQVWTSEKPTAKWSFDLPEGTTGRYIKLALKQPGIFHLNEAAIYGTPLASDN